MKTEVYQIITDRIIERIEKEGKLPWKQPWRNYLSAHGLPQNFVSKKPYRGINIFMLLSLAQSYDCPYFLTYKQAIEKGGNVRKIESTQEDSHIAYLQSWISRLKKDTKLLVQAGAQAQKAVDFILNIKHEETHENHN